MLIMDLNDGTGPMLNQSTGFELFAYDLNKDGADEIFTRTSGSFFGQWLPDLQLYIKNAQGKYILQENVGSPSFLKRAQGNGGYPDLIGGPPEGPGFNEPPTTFDVYRWNGKKYALYKTKQPYVKSDEEFLNKFTYSAEDLAAPTTEANEVKTTVATVPASSESSVANTGVTLLFTNVKTTLTQQEKEAIVTLSGLTASFISETNKKGKPKRVITLFPVDMNNDGSEEIFIRVTTSFLGIPNNEFYLYIKNTESQYQAAPGKIGNGVRILQTSRRGYPDLISGAPGLNREIWSWNGNSYILSQKVLGNSNVQYPGKEVSEVSAAYTSKLQ